MKSVRIIAILVCAASVAACAAMTGISNRYPSYWPAISRSSGCPDVSGDFKNRGIYSYAPNGGSPFLAYALRVQSAEALQDDDTIRIHPLVDGNFVVEALSSGTLVASQRFSSATGDFACEHGALALRQTSETKSDGFGATHMNRAFYLRRATDGSIIGEEHSSGVGVVFIVPLAASQTFWYRWRVKD